MNSRNKIEALVQDRMATMREEAWSDPESFERFLKYFKVVYIRDEEIWLRYAACARSEGYQLISRDEFRETLKETFGSAYMVGPFWINVGLKAGR